MNRTRYYITATLLNILLVVFTISCSSAYLSRKKVAKQFSPVTELQLGRGMAKLITNEYKILANKNISTFINKVGKSTALFSGRADIDYYFGVLDSDDILCFGTPGGYIFLSKGTLKMIQDEAQLSALLAHEIAHVNRRHVLGYLKLFEYSEGLENSKNFDNFMRQSIDRITKHGFSSEEEAEADLDTAAILNATGYSPGAYLDFLKLLSGKDGSLKDAYLKSHPHLEKRIVKIEKHLKDEDYNLKKPKNADRYKKNISSLK